MLTRARVVSCRARSRTLAVIDVYGDEPPPTTTEVAHDGSMPRLGMVYSAGGIQLHRAEGRAAPRSPRARRPVREQLRHRVCAPRTSNGCGVGGAGEYNRYGVCGPAEWVRARGPAE